MHILYDITVPLELSCKENWSHHIENITKKANKSLGFVRRNLGNCPAKLKEQGYMSLVRPHLEYSSSAWDTHLSKHLKQIEMVQRRGARFVKNEFKREPVRLVGGMWDHEGRVEIYLNGAWGTICDDYWDKEDADVACRQLGYGTAITAVSSAGYGEGTGQIWLDDVQCGGSEHNVLSCANRGVGVHNCGHGEDAGVKCISPGKTT
ncbi:putative deleted in malignant brain tumors 1 protein [Apostichopus japonicus]|uniref:Putative deleted in malignant brain tumors 1 protein n=1 Tax=Stichopus japonicus TaxID=307972 RepID=A0A2G8KRX6_STIJA|nr:putative deleted in malignant brain tumors 1 protein [Apostichopus japonicus]